MIFWSDINILYICTLVSGRIKGSDWDITTRLIVVPHAVVIFDLVVSYTLVVGS